MEPLGIKIETARGGGGGIFVSSVSEKSLAAQAGLEVGDQLLEVRGAPRCFGLFPSPGGCGCLLMGGCSDDNRDSMSFQVCGINMRNANYEMAASVLRQCGNSISMLVQYNPDSTSPLASDSKQKQQCCISETERFALTSVQKLSCFDRVRGLLRQRWRHISRDVSDQHARADAARQPQTAVPRGQRRVHHHTGLAAVHVSEPRVSYAVAHRAVPTFQMLSACTGTNKKTSNLIVCRTPCSVFVFIWLLCHSQVPRHSLMKIVPDSSIVFV